MSKIGIFLFIITLLTGAFLLPIGIIKLLNKAHFNIKLCSENYIIVASSVAGFLIILFIIDVVVLKFKKNKNGENGNNTKGNSR
jgi:hypothetical protein